jgi:hypothetical protein
MQESAEFFVKFSGTTNGRDKVFRFFQYLARFAAHNTSSQSQWKSVNESLNNASQAFSMTRKRKVEHAFKPTSPLTLKSTSGWKTS